MLSPSTSKASGWTISNVEASRLTLATLTAPPRPVVHTTRHRKRGYGRKMVAFRGRMSRPGGCVVPGGLRGSVQRQSGGDAL
ncbi:MAG: hypothetical protein AAYR33_03585 [Acetobacteraceae bacterium]